MISNALGPEAKDVAVVAVGGNSLIRSNERVSVDDQYAAARDTCRHIGQMVADGWTVVITHGNGPQVGFILRRSELAAAELHEVPLDVCDADTQGAIGYMLQQNLQNEFRRNGIDREVVSVVTQVEVAADDPAFSDPRKPIGSLMDAAEAERRRALGWDVREDAGRGWRRVVASPRPLRIVEEAVIRHLVTSQVVVVAGGGGGIPVVRTIDGDLQGVAAVVDKDLTASLLARSIDAEVLLITTAVPHVALNYGRADERPLVTISAAEARSLLATGEHFAAGSMEPKVRACVEFLEQGGRCAIITSPETMNDALIGRAGTRLTP